MAVRDTGPARCLSRTARRLRSLAACAALGCVAGAQAANADAPPNPSTLKKLSLEELVNVEVTSPSRRPEPQFMVPAAISVITADELERYGVQTLPEALRLAAGVVVARQDTHTWAVGVRGFALPLTSKLLVLIDGRSVYTPLFSGVFWDLQNVPIQTVERIEVVRGPGGTLWGANAVNGVINVITKRAQATPGTLIEATLAASGAANVVLMQGFKTGPDSVLRAYVKTIERGAMEYSDGRSAQDPFHGLQGGFRFDSVGRADTLTFQGDAYTAEEEHRVQPEYDLHGGNLLARWERRFAGGSVLSIQGYHDRTYRLQPGSFEELLRTWDLDLQVRTPIAKRHHLVWGFGYRRWDDDVENSPVVAWTPVDRIGTLWSGFAQDEFDAGSRVQLTLGVKVEHNDFTGTEVQPTARATWGIGPRDRLWAAITRAVRTPSRVDTDIAFLRPNGTPLLQGDPGFQSETLVSYELGWKRARDTFSLDIATYYNAYDDLRSQEAPVAVGAPVVLGNTLEGRTYGAEAIARFQLTPGWTLRGDASWFHKDLHRKPGSRDISGGVPEGNDPEWSASLRSEHTLSRRSELALWLRHVDALPDPPVPSYTELNVDFGLSLAPSLRIHVAGRNLLDERHAEFGADNPLREEVPRSVFATLRWTR